MELKYVKGLLIVHSLRVIFICRLSVYDPSPTHVIDIRAKSVIGDSRARVCDNSPDTLIAMIFSNPLDKFRDSTTEHVTVRLSSE
jgi:hypothetical protein